MVKQFTPPKHTDDPDPKPNPFNPDEPHEYKPDRRTAEVVKVLDPPPEWREEAWGAIDGALAALIHASMEMEFNRAASSADMSHAAERIGILLEQLRPLLDSFGMLGEFWKAGVTLPSSSDIDRWLAQVKPIRVRTFTPKPDASVVKLAAAQATLLAPLSRQKMTKKQVAQLGAALLGDKEAAGAIYAHLKGKNPIKI